MDKHKPLLRVIRYVILAFLVAESPAALGGNIYSVDVLLHDGRVINIEREVDLKYHGRSFLDLSGDVSGWRPSIYKIRFKHPDNQQKISWQGAAEFQPVLLGIVDGIPYLVVFGKSNKDTENVYGCPELPYIFLKYEHGLLGKWLPIPVSEFPDALQDANLEWNRLSERRTGGYFQAKIPRGFDSWHYSGKNRYKNERDSNDCRPPRQNPPEAVFPPSEKVSLEILETNDFDPAMEVNNEEAKHMIDDKGQGSTCSSLLKPLDPDDPLLAERMLFAMAATEKKEAPHSSFELRQIISVLKCDKSGIWFADYTDTLGVGLYKFTNSGDLLYRISFKRPETKEPPHYAGVFVVKTLKSENGYLYFDWLSWTGIYANNLVKINRYLKIRLPEPISRVSNKANGDRAVQTLSANGSKVEVKQLPKQVTTIRSFRDCPSCPEMIPIPDRNFAMSKYEITQAEWKAVTNTANEDGFNREFIGDNMPALAITWNRAQYFISELNKLTGKEYRLPSEEEWTYACYGGKQTEYCGGDEMDSVYWHNKNSCGVPHLVGQKHANGYGLYDMSGNVWEWMDDCWKGNCDIRIIRGGSFISYPLSVQKAYYYGRDNLDADIGFRIVRVLH